MKKILSFVLLFSLVAVSANAQHFGVQAAGLISKTSIKSDAYSANTKIKPGFLIGATVDIPLNNTMVINAALNFKSNGTWIKSGGDKAIYRLSYVNLDVVYEYIFNIADLEIFAQGGGYIGYCVSGKYIYKPDSGDKTERSLDIGSSETDDLKGLDAGLILGAGIYFGKIRLAASYQPGLVNLSNDNDVTSKNSAGVISFAYFFNR